MGPEWRPSSGGQKQRAARARPEIRRRHRTWRTGEKDGERASFERPTAWTFENELEKLAVEDNESVGQTPPKQSVVSAWA